MNNFKKNKFGMVLLFVQLVLSLAAIFLIFKVNVLPTVLNIILVLVLLLILGVTYYTQASKKASKLNRILGKVFAVIMSALLLIGSIVGYKAVDVLDKISGNNYRTDMISVVVLESNPATSITELAGNVFGIQDVVDRENTEFAIKEIENELGAVEVLEYTSFPEQVEALYNGQVNVLVLNEAFRGVIAEQYPDFTTQTKVVTQFERKVETSNEDTRKFDVTKDAFNVYISGIDTYGPIGITSRSDVNIVVTINPTTKQILLTNVPRDYYVGLACAGGAKDKLTHAGVYGVSCSEQTLENLFDIDIDYYARVNFSSLENIVNALGGIEVYSNYTFHAQGYDFYAGMNYMDGAKALAFSRERYSLPGGDRDRGKNQQAVINGIINKAISPAIIQNYNSVMNAVAGSFETNMPSNDITSLIQMQLSDMSGWTIESISVDGYGEHGPTYSYGSQPLYIMIPDQETVNAAKASIEAVMNAK